MEIQTFPSSYQFAGRKSAVYRQIGNAVPCALAEAVAASFLTVLNACGARLDERAVA
jgi:DNA (cytosine-5)-methyltransferase 1